MATSKKPAPAKKAPAKKRAQPKPGTSKEAAATRKRLFVEAFIANGGNGTEAAISVGLSAKTAGSQASRLLKDVKVQEMLKERRENLAASFELTTEAVLKNLSQAIYFDPRKLYREDGSLKEVWELDDDTAQALAGVEVKEEYDREDGRKVLVGHTKKLKWLDKNAARDQAMKHLGLFREDNKQRSPLDGLPREVLKALAGHLRA